MNVNRFEKVDCKDVDVRKTLEGMSYALVGETSAVQICRWTKNSIRGGRGCWKEKFYGISCAGCCQMTPSVMWCENQCLHCWRPIEMNLGTELPSVDNPIEILDGIVEARKKLLIGFKGRKGIDMEKFESALEPKLYTMSLSGEPTLYPRLGEMFKEIRRRGAVSFLVTNGLNPEVIRSFKKEELPTQITVSTNAPNKKLFDIWHRSTKRNAWEKFNETLDAVRELKGDVRRVVRLTLVKKGDGKFGDVTNMSNENVGEYCDLIRKADADFVHVKGFMSVGYARARMGYDKQPWFDEVLEFAINICENLNCGKARSDNREGSSQRDGGLARYVVAAEDERSCVVMIARSGVELKIEKV